MDKGSTINQYFATIVVHIATFGYGCSEGWITPILPILQSAEVAPLGTPLSDEEISWVVGFLTLGGITGSVIFMYLISVVGRKTAWFIILIPCLIQWILMVTAQEVYHLYIARFVGGMAGGGTFVVAPVMVAEFAEDHVRGSLGSILILALNIGILFAFVIGSVVPYEVVLYIMAAFPVIQAVLIMLVPETPVYLLKQGKSEEAFDSLRWYRGIKKDDKEVDELRKELERIRLANTQKISKHDNKDGISIKDFLTPACIRGLVIGIVLMATQQASGMYAILSYAVTIFDEAGSTLSPNMSSIIVGILQVVGTYASTLLVERAGRKLLLIISCLGTGIGLLALAIYTYLKVVHFAEVDNYAWIPVSSLSICVLMFAVGLAPLPYVVAAEIFSPKVRGVTTPVCVFSVWIFTFITLKFYNSLTQALGSYGIEFIFSACMAFGAVFVWLVIPETKGRPIEDILVDLSGKKKTPEIPLSVLNTIS